MVNFIIGLFIFALSNILFVYQGIVLDAAWGWFLVPHGLPRLGVVTAIAIMSIFNVFFNTPRIAFAFKLETRDPLEAGLMSVIYNFCTTTFGFLYLYILSFFL